MEVEWKRKFSRALRPTQRQGQGQGQGGNGNDSFEDRGELEEEKLWVRRNPWNGQWNMDHGMVYGIFVGTVHRGKGKDYLCYVVVNGHAVLVGVVGHRFDLSLVGL